MEIKSWGKVRMKDTVGGMEWRPPLSLSLYDKVDWRGGGAQSSEQVAKRVRMSNGGF